MHSETLLPDALHAGETIGHSMSWCVNSLEKAVNDMRILHYYVIQCSMIISLGSVILLMLSGLYDEKLEVGKYGLLKFLTGGFLGLPLLYREVNKRVRNIRERNRLGKGVKKELDLLRDRETKPGTTPQSASLSSKRS